MRPSWAQAQLSLWGALREAEVVLLGETHFTARSTACTAVLLWWMTAHRESPESTGAGTFSPFLLGLEHGDASCHSASELERHRWLERHYGPEVYQDHFSVVLGQAAREGVGVHFIDTKSTHRRQRNVAMAQNIVSLLDGAGCVLAVVGARHLGSADGAGAYCSVTAFLPPELNVVSLLVAPDDQEAPVIRLRKSHPAAPSYRVRTTAF